MNDQKYFSRSWAMLTRDKGWIKPILVMAVSQLVPVVGYMGAKGYMLEWARLTAWGVDSSPKQKNVQVGKCVTSGARGFVVELGWGIAIGLATSIITAIFGLLPGTFGEVMSGMVSFALTIVSAFLGMAIVLAQVRAAIYENIGAGYRPDRLVELIKRDVNGFVRIFAIELVGSIILGVFIAIVVIACIFMMVPAFIGLGSGHYTSEREIINVIMPLILPILLGTVVFGFIFAVLYIILRMVVFNAMGLWLRQFNVPQWGRSEDPLPAEGPAQQAPQQQYYGAPQQGNPMGYGAPTQQPPVQQQPVQQQPPMQQPMQQEPLQQPPVQQVPVQQQPIQQQPPVQQVAEPDPVQPIDQPTPTQPIASQQKTVPLPHKEAQETVIDAPASEPEPQLEPQEPDLMATDTTPLSEQPESGSDPVEDLYDQTLESIKDNDFVKEDDDE